MATVQANILRFLAVVDPTMKDGTVISSSNISTWSTSHGDKFTSARILDCYNQSRMSLFGVLRTIMDDESLGKIVGELLVSTTIDFGSAAAKTDAPKPSGYIKFVGLSSSADIKYPLLPQTLINVVRQGSNDFYVQSSTNAFVFDEGSNLVSYGTVGVNSGNAFITGSSNKFLYYGITDFTLSDITGGSTTETYNDVWVPVLLELAIAIANGLGNQQVNELAKKLITAKGNN